MPGFIPEEIINDVLDRIDIVELISGYIPLKRAGRNFKTLCPFHHEKTPSFMVSPDRQIYHCFGCFPPGSLIKTENGFHKIEDIQMGQLVLTHRGRFKPIIRTLWRHYNGELIELYTRKSNLPVTVTADHKIFAIKIKNCKYKSKESRICQWRCKLSCPAKFFKEYKIQQLPAKQLTLNDYLLYPINQKINDIKFIDLNKYYNRKISNFGPDIKSILTKIEVGERFLKLIGYWIAEGSNHRAYIRFSLGNHEGQFAKEIKELIEDIFHIKTSIYIRKRGNRTGIEVTACNSKLSNIFENLCGKTAENKHIPFELQNLSPKLQRIILDAIFRGDGCIGKVAKSKTNRKFKSITTVSLVLAEQLKDILLRLVISPTFRVEKAKIDKNSVKHKTAYIISWQEDIKLHFSNIIQINNISYQILPIRKIIKKNFTGDVYNLTVAEDHSYTTPNFVVGNCGAGGNAYSFLMKYERLEFPEAVEMLAKKVGVQLPIVSSESSLKENNLNKQLYQANELASIYYHRLLETEEGKRGLFYLRKRGLRDETITKFKLGYAHNAWDGLLNFVRKKGFKLEILERAGLIIPREGGGHFDRFRDRVIFPIFEVRGKVIGFGGRALNEESLPKYMNSPETGVYSKGRHLYGLNFALEHIKQIDFLIIVEGYLDLITPHQFGLKNIVSSLGTALTTEQIRLLKRYTKDVVMVYDADQAGEAASLRGLDLLIEEGLNVKVVNLPQGFDPDDYVCQKGISNFQEEIKAARDLFGYKLNLLVTKYNPKSLEDKIKIINEMLPTISKVENAVLKSCYIKSLAESLCVEEESLLIELKKVKEKTYRNLSDEDKAGFVRLDVKPAEKLILRLMLEDNEFIRECKERLVLADFQSPNAKKVAEVLFEFNSQNKKIIPNKLINYFQDDRTSRLVSSLIASDEEIMDRKKTFEDCIKRVKKDGRENRLKTIENEIKSIQASKDEDRLEKLVVEYDRLIKQKARD